MTREVFPYDIVKIGLSRHGHQYSESLNFREWIKATLNPLTGIQDCAFDLLDIDLDTAEGVKLDLIGRIVGAPSVIPNVVPDPFFGFSDQLEALNFGEIDDPSEGGFFRELGQNSYSQLTLTMNQYRTIIKAQIIKNVSLCTPNDIIKIVDLIINSEIEYSYIEYPMFIVIAPREPFTRLQVELLKIMIPRPCGVGFGVIDGYYDDFGFYDQVDALGFGELSDPIVGGFWTTVPYDIKQIYEEV